LRLKAESFPSELEKAVQTAVKETTARLDKDYKFEKQLLLKDHEGEIKLKNQQIESLMAKIKDLELQLKQAYSKAENAENNSKEITLRQYSPRDRSRLSRRRRHGGKLRSEG
jgi:hypothetical protein